MNRLQELKEKTISRRHLKKEGKTQTQIVIHIFFLLIVRFITILKIPKTFLSVHKEVSAQCVCLEKYTNKTVLLSVNFLSKLSKKLKVQKLYT